MTITAKILADSISEYNIRLVTLQLRYPRFIHSEFLTHRVFSRNASSSRAIPVKRLIQDIIDDPVYPSFWGSNKPGMQAGEEIDETVYLNPWWPNEKRELDRKAAWDAAKNEAIRFAQSFSDAGYHKQIVNRLLEPFSHINVVVTSTDWNNFFSLRMHPDAQPEIRILAEQIHAAMQASTPQILKQGQWHLPYIDSKSKLPLEDRIKVSAARCARVSFLTHDGRVPDVSADIALYEKLAVSTPLHASPCEHQATPDIIETLWDIGYYNWKQPELHGNFNGWIQFRKTLDNEYIE